MEKIVEEKENPLFRRIELAAQISHEKAATPTREAFRKRIAALKNAELSTVVVRSIESTFGMPQSKAIVHIYETADLVLKTEATYVLKRNSLIEDEDAGE